MRAGALTEDEVHSYVRGICFKTGPPGRVGVELEWFATDPDRPYRHVPVAHLDAALRSPSPLPSGGALTYEPGGQLELSSRPHCFPDCYPALCADIGEINERLAGAGYRLVGYGIDPHRGPVRQLNHPRYVAMEQFFDSRGPSGRLMMCSTAATQVNVDTGADPTHVANRWALAHRVGPVLVAAFANSPIHRGRVTGWRSTRQAVWAHLDTGRTAPPPEGDPVESWTGYVLDAEVMLIRRECGWIARPGLTFRQWMSGMSPDGYGIPSDDDLAYHLTTLFPPVRPQGRLELRMIDAQPLEHWPVPLAVVSALFDDPVAADQAREAVEPVAGWWLHAARAGLADTSLAKAAARCFSAAIDALPRLGAKPELTAGVERFAERFVLRGTSPADELLSRREESHA